MFLDTNSENSTKLVEKKTAQVPLTVQHFTHFQWTPPPDIGEQL